MKKKIKVIGISLMVLLSSGLFIQASDDYFEISKNLDIFASLYREINTNYVDDTKPGKLMKVGIDAMLKSLDPYTNYISESQIEDFRFMTTGQYGGIGALIQKRDDFIIISETYDGFPAQKEGIMVGDKLIEIDGEDVRGKSTSEISEFLKGQADTEVNIKIERGLPGNEKVIEKKVKRAEISIKNVPYYDEIEDGVGYIRLTGFMQTAASEFSQALKELKDEKEIASLIIDLRGNGGGLLREAVSIVNFFVKKGTEVVRTRGKLKEWEQVYKALNSPMDLNIPIVVLVDQNSASASEIVAGALQDLDRGVIIGKETFGKGLVQQTVDLSYNSKLKVTVAKYYTPSGRCIQRINYSERESDGRAREIPDSLIREFKSLVHNRPLFDGKGIKPDIEIGDLKLSNISFGLLRDYYVFDYATQYRLNNNAIAGPSEFKVDEGILTDFKSFVQEKDFSYETEAEEILEELKESTKEEDYYASLESEFEILKNRLSEEKQKDFERHKDEIVDILSAEIVLRYHNQRGELIYSLKNDEFVEKAKEVLKDEGLYNSILEGTYNPE